ncbi:UNVERIFIED_CONTAM: protein sym1 [Sesamum calycinum]|uniref:Protein sym1 n=1 Tax=Sesamum calycinum TaxID=2727403 RepID=A0AAW2QMJ0_9LAMI
MRFHLITHFAQSAIVQSPRRRLSALYNQQCRAYAPAGHHHHHQFTRKTRVSDAPSHFSSYFSFFHRFYSSKPSNPDMGLLSWYLGMLESRPVLTKSISAAVIYAAADITSQLITLEPNGTWDSIRTLRMAGFGLIILGPAQHVWFNFVGRLLPKRDLITTFKKLAMGQLFYGPMINGVFFSYNAALQGENGNEIASRLKRDLIPTLLNGLMYWPLCDFFTYKIIPVHLQPLINSSFSYLWTIYLTYMASLGRLNFTRILKVHYIDGNIDFGLCFCREIVSNPLSLNHWIGIYQFQVLKKTMKSESGDKMITPVIKVWTKVSDRLRRRESGIVKLRKDVRSCKYEDVHTLWDMIQKNETELAGDGKMP